MAVLKPLPFAEAARLVQMYGTPAIRGEAVDGLDTIRSQSTSFETLTGYSISARYLPTAAGPERVMTVSVEREFFTMLRTAPIAGRVFGADDPSTVAVVSEPFSRRFLGGPSSAVGAAVAVTICRSRSWV